jgi:hypothetical protein
LNDIKELLDCSDDQTEYWSHVADQHELPIAPGRELPTKLEYISNLLSTVDFSNPQALKSILAASLIQTPDLLDEVRLFAGLSDKRLYLSLSYEFSRTLYQTGEGASVTTLCGCEPSKMKRHTTHFFKNMLGRRSSLQSVQAADKISDLLLRNGIADTLEAYAKLTPDDQRKLLLRLVFTKEAQQNEAKRRGHGAEALIAQVLQFAGCSILPPDKATNPIGARDPNIDLDTLEIANRDARSTMSSDIAVLGSAGELRAWVVGLVQSSDPGQFGVDKSNTTQQIRARIDRANQEQKSRLELWGIVDGVGYSENKAGTINPMLQSFHQFFQVKSAYKAALAAHRLGLGRINGVYFDVDSFYTNKTKNQMIERYVPEDVQILDSEQRPDSSWHRMTAGYATIFRKG